MRATILALLVGCGAAGNSTGDTSIDGACGLAAANVECPACSDGPWACTYDTTTVTVAGCGGCEARLELYAALCDAGENDFADTIEALTVCEPVTCEVRYPCGCTPNCAASNVTTTATCSETCATPEPAPADCVWTGTQCGWAE